MSKSKPAAVVASAAPAADTPAVRVGDIVIYRQSLHEEPYNGTREHPAIVTRVWGRCVNLTVMHDGMFGGVKPVTSVDRAMTHPGADAMAAWRTRDEAWPEVAESASVDAAATDATGEVPA